MMSVSNITHAPLLTLLIFFFISSLGLSFSGGNNTILCPEIEKQSLLSFKQSFKDPKNQLSSWDGEANCCKWEGVICNDITGHVHQLLLPSMHLDGNINPSLLNLKYLSYLDLSGNDLLGGTMPSFLGSFAKLEYLNLSGTGFHGEVPHTIGNLSDLRTLDLGGVGWMTTTSLLVVDSIEWMTRLPHLQYLNMNGANLSKVSNWAQVTNSLPSLVELHFVACNLDFLPPLDYVNISSLKHLYLSGNSYQSFTTIPRWIFQLPNLLSLDLSWNSFYGPIPTISNATKLQHIDLFNNFMNSSIPNSFYLCKKLEFVDLSGNLITGTISNSIRNLTSLNTLVASNNQLSGKIPKEISNLCKLRRLDLSSNNLRGEILGNMSECFLEVLEELNLGGNQFSGHLTNQFGEFKNLRLVYLSNNSLSGVIPTTIGKLASLEELWLNDNKFTGTLPESLGQLFNLRLLLLEHNMLKGVVTETHFANLTKLVTLLGKGNQLTLKVSPNWIPPFQLTTIDIAAWNLGVGSHILSWLETQKMVTYLDLSNTGISGNIPSWVWKIQVLILPHNRLHGNILIADTAWVVDLSNNSFSGDISRILCDSTTYQTYGLESLHLEGNELSGEFPDCWTKWPSLKYLYLGNNNISGRIPNSIGFLADLSSLNLQGNRLSGAIPFSMHNCTKLGIMNLADNDLDGGIPTWVGTHLWLKILILRSNKLSGKIPPKICLLSYLKILDLSDNKLSGIIPNCLSNLSGMATKEAPLVRSSNGNDVIGLTIYTDSASVAIKGSELEYGTTLYLVTDINLSKNNLSGNIPKELTSLVELRSLNLSQNRLSGSIPEKIGDMKQLESLDFSMNCLFGQIPKSLALLPFLSYLNLSYNKMTGEIPKSTQLQSLNASSFDGNNLCGPPLTILCRYDGAEGSGQKEENEGEEESKIEWLYVVVSLGYAMGFSAVCSTLVMNKSWREAYFGLLGSMWDKLYVYVCIKFNKLSAPEESG